MLKKACMMLVALVCTGAVIYLLWNNGTFLPGWISWKSGSFGDRSGNTEAVLDNKSVLVKYKGETVWTSPEGVKVQEVLWADVDNDRKEELVILCWKAGRYGKARPFWVEKDEKKWSQHLFVYEYEGDKIRAKWMSSYLGMDVESVSANGKEAPSSRLYLTDREGKVSSWRWDSWGFTREEREVSFVIFGDNLLHEPLYRYGLNNHDFGFLFENIKETVGESDIAVINQETPLTDNPDWYGGYPRFGTPVQAGEAIAEAGFDVVTCATNHILDRGKEGVCFTRNFFEEKGIKCLGIQPQGDTEYRPFEVIERNGIRFGLLNYTYGTNGNPLPEQNPWMVHLLEDEGRIREDIALAKEESDFLVLFAHWGTEGSGQIDEFQEKWTGVFLESGVDVVIGTHPHTLQPFEMLEGEDGRQMLVYYSIGNYISAQQEKSCIKGGMARFTVSLTPEGYRITEYDLALLAITRQEKGRYTVELCQSPENGCADCPKEGQEKE